MLSGHVTCHIDAHIGNSDFFQFYLCLKFEPILLQYLIRVVVGLGKSYTKCFASSMFHLNNYAYSCLFYFYTNSACDFHVPCVTERPGSLTGYEPFLLKTKTKTRRRNAIRTLGTLQRFLGYLYTFQKPTHPKPKPLLLSPVIVQAVSMPLQCVCVAMPRQ